jgi:hypothetical protein
VEVVAVGVFTWRAVRFGVTENPQTRPGREVTGAILGQSCRIRRRGVAEIARLPKCTDDEERSHEQ